MREGLLRIEDDKTIHLSEAFRQDLMVSYGMQLRHLMLSVSRAACLIRPA